MVLAVLSGSISGVPLFELFHLCFEVPPFEGENVTLVKNL